MFFDEAYVLTLNTFKAYSWIEPKIEGVIKTILTSDYLRKKRQKTVNLETVLANFKETN